MDMAEHQYWAKCRQTMIPNMYKAMFLWEFGDTLYAEQVDMIWCMVYLLFFVYN